MDCEFSPFRSILFPLEAMNPGPIILVSRKVILIMEDDENDVFLYQRALRSIPKCPDYFFTRDGQEGIDYLSGRNEFSNRNKHPLPALILMDLKMPRMSGFDVLDWRRTDANARLIPLVVFSSSTHGSDVRKAYDMGANAYFTKPHDYKELSEKLTLIDSFWKSAVVVETTTLAKG